jgi:hypothetical protein
MRPGKVDNTFYLWFQMQIGSLDQLEPLPQENHIYLEINPTRGLDYARLLPMIKNSRDYEIKVIPPNEKISKEKFWAFQFFVTKSWDAFLPQVRRVNVNRPPYVIVKDLQTGKGETRSQIKLEGFG